MLGPILRNAIVMVVLVFGGMVLLGYQFGPAGPSGKTTRVSAPKPSRTAAYSTGGETLVIPPGRGGHYAVDAQINGREIGMLVDTGATLVALSREDAEEIGIAAFQLDYSGRVATANGTARAARVILDEIALGDIVVRDVSAVVIDAPLATSLLGMSFLSRLGGFTVKDGKLILRR